MDLPKNLTDKGFALFAVKESDLPDYLFVKKYCYKKYVDEYYGGWIDDMQIDMNTDIFEKTIKQTCFQKIMLYNKTVGFFGYNELEDKIGGITIQMIKEAQNHGLGSYYLEYLLLLSAKSNKPIFLKVFKSNPAQNLYKRFGFEIYDETSTHYLMKYIPTV
jgi:ribosomal protein S18 acetylase RimI-like enzyme